MTQDTPAESTKLIRGFICAKWKRLSDGCVARCDLPHAHKGRHVDNVIAVGWEKPRYEVLPHVKPMPFKVYDNLKQQSVAFTASAETAQSWAKQLNEVGYVTD